MAHPDKMPTHCALFLPAGLHRVSGHDHTVITRSKLWRLFARITKRA
jgi:hypothetical protein